MEDPSPADVVPLQKAEDNVALALTQQDGDDNENNETTTGEEETKKEAGAMVVRDEGPDVAAGEDKGGMGSRSNSGNNMMMMRSMGNFCAQNGSQLAALFDDFMQFGSVGLHIVDNQGIIVWANRAELELLGYTEAEYFGKPIADFHVDQGKIQEILTILLSGQKLTSYIAPIRCKDGHTEYVEINSSMRQHNGQCVTTRCFSACVTDRILRERAQLEAVARQKEAEFIKAETQKKTSFLRKLCHELRNPLAGVTGNLDLLLTELQAADASTTTTTTPPGVVVKSGVTVDAEEVPEVTEDESSVSTATSVAAVVPPKLFSEEWFAALVAPLLAHLQDGSTSHSFALGQLVHMVAKIVAFVLGVHHLSLQDDEEESEEVHVKALEDVPELPVEDEAEDLKERLRLAELAEARLAQATKQLEATQNQLTATQERLTAAEERLSVLQNRISGALEYAEYAQLAAEHQMLVINDTLSLSKLESEEFEFCPRPVDFEEVVTVVVGILDVKAKEKGVDLHVDLAPAARFATTDVVWVKQVLINLLSNAIKFTPQGHVDLRVTVLSQDEAKRALTLEIAVKDTGIGMTAEEQSKLFGVFSQANQLVSAQFGGSGLGLHIVKQVLDHVGGSVRVESEKGVGSSFICALPCGMLTPEELAKFQQPSPSPVTTTTSLTRSTSGGKRGEAAESTPQAAAAPALVVSDIRVLVVDDIQINRKLLCSYLRRRGYAFDVAENGLVALEMHKQQPFAIVLTDIDMPVMDGMEMTVQIRAWETETMTTTARRVPVIGISGNVFPEDAKNAHGVGINEYIHKPFKFPELEAMMIKYLEGEQQQRD